MSEGITQNIEWLRQTVGSGGSFLTIRRDIIYMAHQSAKDYLLAKVSADVFPSGEGEVHYQAFSRSLTAMSSTLRRDIYDIRSLGRRIEQVETPSPDPLAMTRYSCIYWVDHLYDWIHSSDNFAADLQEGGSVDLFLIVKYLYWLEALSLCGSVSQGALGMVKLEMLIQVSASSSNITNE